MDEKQLQSYLSGNYRGIEEFLDNVIFPIFGEDNFEDHFQTELLENHTEWQSLANATGIRSIKQVGLINNIGVTPLQIFDITVADNVLLERNRVTIQRLIRAVMLQYSCAFMIFHYDSNDQWDWRFTYCYKSGKEKESTDTKRYTFLLGPGQSCRTAAENFMELYNKRGHIDYQDITQAFSVEALTKQFYKELFEWYQWAVDPSTNVTFPNNTSLEEDDRDDIETKVIRMITRIMFVWFIKQKELVPSRIFDKEYLATILKDFDPESATDGTFYNAILQNLFFATLNRAIVDERGNTRRFATSTRRDIKTLYRYAELFSISEEEVIELFAEVPFLNGGLFECLDKTKTIDGVPQAYYFDGFSRNDIRFSDGRYKHRAVVPNALFFDPDRGLISILSRYNFTIEENSPKEQQVALDPELLGRVFENLLGAYNPETRETARNQSGSFYTPREIVHYMVDESLIAYLGDTPEVRALFSEGFEYDDTKQLWYEEIAAKLMRVKVLDPACGSGAFPMGLLNRIVEVLVQIVPGKTTYEMKLAIIENCLYGSDIQCIATQITKLRFFISLICECHKDPDEPNFGIPMLPNLETNFVAANSLVGIKKSIGLLPSISIVEKKKELVDIRHSHFSATSTSTKIRLRQRDEEVRQELASLLADDMLMAPDDVKQLTEWDPYDQNSVSPFFDPEWMFGVSDGFDIVIGNPPYIQLQNNNGALAKLYDNGGYDSFARTGDIYCLFYERGYQLLKAKGHLCYITSNKWMRAGYGEKLRAFFAKKTNPIMLIDFAGVKIFESATVDTNILLFSKESNQGKTICAVTSKHNGTGVDNLSLFIKQQQTTCCFTTSDSWIVLTPIEQSIKSKIETVGTPLKDWDIQIYRGVLTGCNEAFIINKDKRKEILCNCQTKEEEARTDELIRPILRGRDIKRYGYEWAELWLIYIPWHFPLHNDPTIKGASEEAEKTFESEYSAIYNHLLQYKEKLSKRNKAETGIRYEWYALQRWGAKYQEDFSKPKIAWNRIASIKQFAIIDEGIYIQDSMHFITGEKLNYICSVLNSKVIQWLLSIIIGEAAGGNAGNADNIWNVPIPMSDSDNSVSDNLLYDRYGLTKDEVDFIESQ